MKSFPIELVREQFPSLSANTAYLDNPAGTQLPRSVIQAVSDAMMNAASNLGGYFEASSRAVQIWNRAHDAMAELLGGNSGQEILLGQSMTMLTFHLSRSMARTWKPGDEIIVTRMDHEGNVAPWVHAAEDRGVTVRWLPFNRDTWRVEPEDLRALLTDRTRLVALNHASNLTGSINPVAELTACAHSSGALVYVDSVQFAPHGKVEVAVLNCDFLACSSYKFFGPHLGVLWGRQTLLEELHPYAPRCAPDRGPGRHELGTPQTELFAGLAATVDYFVWLGEQVNDDASRVGNIKSAYRASSAYEMPLAQQLIDGLLKIPGVRLFGLRKADRNACRVPTVSITHSGTRNTDLARSLAGQDINVWSGHNYAYEVARQLELDENEGVLRIGLAHYNTEDEVARVVDAIRSLVA